MVVCTPLFFCVYVYYCTVLFEKWYLRNGWYYILIEHGDVHKKTQRSCTTNLIVFQPNQRAMVV